MDTLEHYRELSRNIILKYAQYKPSNGEIEPEAILDLEGASQFCKNTQYRTAYLFYFTVERASCPCII